MGPWNGCHPCHGLCHETGYRGILFSRKLPLLRSKTLSKPEYASSSSVNLFKSEGGQAFQKVDQFPDRVNTHLRQDSDPLLLALHQLYDYINIKRKRRYNDEAYLR
jgi:hypothetical protein